MGNMATEPNLVIKISCLQTINVISSDAKLQNPCGTTILIVFLWMHINLNQVLRVRYIR